MATGRLRAYYRLTKPGIVYGNAFSTIAGFAFAAGWKLSFLGFVLLFIPTLVGSALVVASAGVFNNYIDRGIDSRMERTKQRPLVTRAIAPENALRFAAVIGLLGLTLLYFEVTVLTAAVALFGFLMYTIVYGSMKRVSYWAAVVGSIPGAVPIVIGYTAVTNQLTLAGLILFLILAFWQMPHFYAIALYRLKEYQAAGIPVLPAVRGVQATKVHLLFFVLAFTVATAALWAAGFAGLVYLAIMLSIDAVWLMWALHGFFTPNESRWARGLFFYSLFVLVVFCVSVAVAPFF